MASATLNGTVNYIAGGYHDSGPITMAADGYTSSHITLDLSDGSRSEIITGASAASGTSTLPELVWRGPDGRQHVAPAHNSLYWPAWFFPALAVSGLANDRTYTWTDLGRETIDGTEVEHFQVVQNFPGVMNSDPETQRLLINATTTHLYLNSGDHLPVEIEFNLHPDDDAGVNVPVRVKFDSYTDHGGVLVPGHIRKFVNGALLLDVTVTGVAISSAPPLVQGAAGAGQ